ncbi:MAG: AMP-binding protein, partial [Burkholderiaceae bacterium]
MVTAYNKTKTAAVHQRSLAEREAFWSEQANLIHWFKPAKRVLGFDKPPFTHWYEGGETNLCFNAIDRHLQERGDQLALVYLSTETNEKRELSYRELHREVQAMAAVMKSLGVGKGDRVLIYMPMIAEAIFAMLACARIGAIHSVVFGGFAAPSLAARIDDAKPKLMVSSDAGMRGGKEVPYKNLVDTACDLAQTPPEKVLMVNRGLVPLSLKAGRDLDYA